LFLLSLHSCSEVGHGARWMVTVLLLQFEMLYWRWSITEWQVLMPQKLASYLCLK
jgi:hypothetical protein